MAHQHNQSSKPPVDDDENRSIPLPCCGRGQPLIPLEDLPLFKFLKRRASEQGILVGKGRGRPPCQNSRPSTDESFDVEHKKDVGKFGCFRKTPLVAAALNSGLEPMNSAQERSEVLCRPSTSQQSPGPQSSHSADRPRHTPHTSGPPTSRRHQKDRPTRRSSQPSPSRLQQRHSVPPKKGSKKRPSGSDGHGGARRKMRTTSRNTGQGASRSARKARRPAKKATFDPSTFRHATDLNAWAESLSGNATFIPDDEFEDDESDVQMTTLRREAEAEHYDTLMFPPDSEDELTDCSEDEAQQHDGHGDARRKMPTTSRNTGQGASQSARKARRPAKKATFDPSTYRHPTDLSAWAESLSGNATFIPDDEFEDDESDVQMTTLRREAEAEHYDTLMFSPDSEDELTDSSEDEAQQHVSSEDSIYDSLSSMSLESTTDLMYETAAETTPGNCSPVREPAKTASPKGSSESLEAKNSSQALSAESVYNSIVSSAHQHTSQAVNAESIHNSIISSRAEICAQETLLCSTAACKTVETDLPAATSMTLEIKGLPKGTTPESLYKTVSSFTPVYDVCVTEGDEVYANITLTKPCNVAWLMKCLGEALALEGNFARAESDGPSTGGTLAAAVEEKTMKTEESEEPKKDETESEDEIIRDPAFLLYVLGNLPGVDPQSKTVRNAVREVTQGDRAKKDKGAQDKGKSSKDKQ